MANLITVAKTMDIQEGAAKVVEVDGKPIALFNVHGKFFAMDNTCAHRGGPLGEGMIDDNIVTCPWHGWQWDVTCGKSLFNPNVTLKTYPVVVEASEIKIDVS